MGYSCEEKNLIKVALVLELELGFNRVNHIKPRRNPNTNINMNPIPIQNYMYCSQDDIQKVNITG